MTRFAPHARVLVSPRRLAGAGIDRLANAIGPLIARSSAPSATSPTSCRTWTPRSSRPSAEPS
ncbi:hypothetical protein AB0D59_32305 [Streptomyces sp. NPDC048417]|uniref:hypothetical protein n=1 Tax=Streptomyces sp. NPDC048417 TaxID=3155387 RepID=UPI003439E189